MSDRVYLDWNATAPLRDEARTAMIAAMDVIGNPSSVHNEGRAAKAIIENSRMSVAALVGCDPTQIVFTSGATEAAAMALSGQDVVCGGIEHECVADHCRVVLDCAGGAVTLQDGLLNAQQGANSETGILQDVQPGVFLTDQVQVAGKMSLDFAATGSRFGLISAHKFGGPKGVGALLLQPGADVDAILRGGGQEMGRRSGTENVVGIAGFGAAAEAAMQGLASGVWERVKKLRTILENELALAAPNSIIVGQDMRRLPNTTCIITPGWKGETQVMQMDLAGFAISAGSACSSGKVKESRVLRAMGFDEDQARSAIRISLGPTTREEDVTDFCGAWRTALARQQARAT